MGAIIPTICLRTITPLATEIALRQKAQTCNFTQTHRMSRSKGLLTYGQTQKHLLARKSEHLRFLYRKNSFDFARRLLRPRFITSKKLSR